MKGFTYLSASLALIPFTQAHMEMSWPPPFRSRHNPFTTDVDYNLVDPLRADGSNYPCKGYHSLIGTSQGQAVVTWEPGKDYNFTIIGGATHDGGSCQASLSYDRGKSWKVIQSFHGGCPLRSNWQFTLPQDTPAGDALFAWSWFNRIGNREMYMNCARVVIKGNSKVRRGNPKKLDDRSQPLDLNHRATVPFSARPNMFVANVNNGCSTIEMFDVVFPDPGPNVQGASDRPSPPRGQNCGAPAPGWVSTTTMISSSTHSTSTRTSASSSATGNPAAAAAKLWGQCGGRSWTGPTQCQPGLECQRQSEWYSQCIPSTAQSTKQTAVTTSRPATTTSKQSQPQTTTTSVTGNPAKLAAAWGKCGGVSWNGPTACMSGWTCNRQSEWYSQCIPSAQQPNNPQPQTTSASGNSPRLSAVWGQCGGVSWSGPTACQPGLVCNRQSEWYSQCIPG